MTTDYRAMCAELVAEIEKWQQADDEFSDAGTIRADANYDLAPRARALLAQPVPEGPKPVVDYSRVPEIATEAQIRSAAQYLVKKRNCDGDLISAIEYAIARWGRPTLQPVAVSERLPGPEDCDEQGRCWLLTVEDEYPQWRLHAIEGAQPGGAMIWVPVDSSPGVMVDCFYTSHWLTANALPTPEATNG